MVKKYLIIAIVIVLSVFVILNSSSNNYSKLLYSNIPINYNQLSLESNQSELNLDLHYIEKNNLYLSIQNTSFSQFGKTEALIIYDMEKETTQKFKLKDDVRIVNFLIANDSLYFIIIETGNDNIGWKLIQSNLSFENQYTIKSGEVTTPLLSPNIKLVDDNIFFVTLDTTLNKFEYTFYIIEDKELKTLLKIDGNQEKLFDLEKVVIKNNDIYYISTTEDKQSLKKYNFDKNLEEVIYYAKDSKEFIFEFELLDNLIIINCMKDNKSKLIYKYSNGETQELQNNIEVSFVKKINDNNILTHNEDKTFRIFNSEGEETEILNYYNLNIFPKYEIYKSQFLIFQTFDNKSHIHKLKNLN